MQSTGSLTVDEKSAGTFDSKVFGKDGKHWWPSIFNPSFQSRKKGSIHAHFDLTMPNEQLYFDFKDRWKIDKRLSNWNDKNHSFSVDY